MVVFNFEIDKEACFAYFIQSLIDWGWFFNEKNQDYFSEQIGGLENEEKKSLEKLKKILQKDNNYFLWLWRRYDNLDFRDSDEKDSWEEIKKILWPKFEKIWDIEFKKMEEWRKELATFSFEKFNKDLEKVSNFFNFYDYPKEIRVKLMFHWDRDNVTAHVRADFNDLILLNLSNLKNSNISKKRVINVLLHEFIHKIQYQSDDFYKIIKKSEREIIDPRNITFENDIKWKYLLEETIVNAIASRRFNSYFGRKLTDNESIIEADKIISVDLEKNRNNFGYLIRFIAGEVEDKVSNYLKDNKKFDLELSNFIAQNWVNFLTKK
jgi:hypothetical protein